MIATALAELVRTLGEDPAIGQVLVFYDQPHGLRARPRSRGARSARAIIAGAALSPVPTLVSSTLPELLDDGAAWRVRRRGRRRRRRGCAPGCAAPRARWRRRRRPERLREIAATARRAADGRRREGAWLAEHDAKALLRDAGVAVPDGRVVPTRTTPSARAGGAGRATSR